MFGRVRQMAASQHAPEAKSAQGLYFYEYLLSAVCSARLPCWYGTCFEIILVQSIICDRCRPWSYRDMSVNEYTCLLSTRIDRQGVDISFTVYLCLCVCVCTVTDFSADDKASGVKFCTAVHRRPRQVITNFCELCFPRSPKSDESASARATATGMYTLP